MDSEKQLSAQELERLLVHRRRQEAVEGLRSLGPGPHQRGRPSTLPDTLFSAAFSSAEQSVIRTRLPLVESHRPGEGNGELWRRQLTRLQPLNKARNQGQLPVSLRRFKKLLSVVVDGLIVLVLILFIVALGFWVYDTYVSRVLNGGSAPTVQAQGSWTQPVQGRLSSPEEAMPQAPLPFVPYSTTVVVEDPFIPAPTPAPGTVMPSRLVVPRIQLDTPVVEVTIQDGIWQVAEYAAGYHRGTARPGAIGNTVISGHNGMHGAVFRRLHELDSGDEVLLYAGRRLYRYVVEGRQSVWPYQVEVMAQTPTPILTLITCTAYDTQRLVVIARLDREIPTEATP